MSDDKEEILKEEIRKLEEQMRVIAEKIQELTGIDCSFGSCVFDPEMKDAEEKIAEVQRKKSVLERVLKELEACER